MRIHRRRILQLGIGAFALPAMPHVARAQTYPSRPIRFIVGFGAGGGGDLQARLIGQALSDRIGQPVVIENRPGAGGSLATEMVVNAPPDGYTMLFVGNTHAIGASIYKLSYNFVRDIAPVAGGIRLPNVMEVSPDVPARTVSEFIIYAKANAGKVAYASSGSGTTLHLSAELFKMMTNVELIHVPYNRGLAAGGYADMMSGRVHVLFDNLTSSIELIRSSKLRALAITTAARSPALPDIPTVGEFVPGYEVSVWSGIGVPRNTPPQIIGKLNAEVNAALADEKLKVRIADLGASVMSGTPAEFGKLIVDETEKWAKVVKFGGLKPE
jgi:tripartite-type tricarboxylate transporter receptor subunit TctC